MLEDAKRGRVMAKDFILLFRGARHPRARIQETIVDLVTDADGTEHRRDDKPVFLISAPGVGTPWQTDEADAFWMDFAELDLADSAKVLKFVKRRGLVSTLLADDPAQELTKDLFCLQASLQTLAKAWEPQD